MMNVKTGTLNVNAANSTMRGTEDLTTISEGSQDTACELLRSSHSGISSSEAKLRRGQYGANLVSREQRLSLFAASWSRAAAAKLRAMVKTTATVHRPGDALARSSLGNPDRSRHLLWRAGRRSRGATEGNGIRSRHQAVHLADDWRDGFPRSPGLSRQRLHQGKLVWGFAACGSGRRRADPRNAVNGGDGQPRQGAQAIAKSKMIAKRLNAIQDVGGMDVLRRHAYAGQDHPHAACRHCTARIGNAY